MQIRIVNLCLLTTFLLTLKCSLSTPPHYKFPDGSSTDTIHDETSTIDTMVDNGTDNITPETPSDRQHITDIPVEDGENTCPEGEILCNGQCVNPLTDSKNCGGCGNTCPEQRMCVNGNCECIEGLTECDGICVDTSSDPMNCGGCDNVCSSGEGAHPVCDDGVCTTECNPNHWDLNGDTICEYYCEKTSETESCNGQDDNCDGYIDEDFECIAGTVEECSTVCSTAGTRSCDAETCEWSNCCAEAEVCGNGCDDNCSGIADEGCTTPPPNDICAGAIDVSSQGRFYGSTELANNDSDPPATCAHGSRGGKDVYYFFTIDSASDVFIATYGSSFDTVLYVGSTCGAGDMGCIDDYSPGGAPSLNGHLQINSLSPGTYYITIDGYDSSAFGDFQFDIYITARLSDAGGDTCGHPLEFTSGTDGELCIFTHDTEGSCNSRIKPDGVYFFIVPQGAGTINLTFSTCNSHTNFDTVLYLRNICNEPATEITCDDDMGVSSCPSNSLASSINQSLPPGLYYLYIDGGWNACRNPSRRYPYRIIASW